jgi:hypothetical protein
MPKNKQNREIKTGINFFGDSDYDLHMELGREVFEGFVGMRILLYRLDRTTLPSNSFYGQVPSSEKVWLPEIELYGSFNLEKGKTERLVNSKVTKEFFGSAIFSCYQEHLDELGVEMHIGDFLGYYTSNSNIEYFEITNTNFVNKDNKNTVFSRPFSRIVECVHVQYDIFNGNNEIPFRGNI